MATREWDARTYDSLPLPHVGWGQRVLDLLDLSGSERILDAGCGTGRDAAALLQRRPDARVVGIDGSQQMIDQARARLGDGVELMVADLTKPLPIEPVDVVMSVAAFHWITDHEQLFANLGASVVPGGRLVSDCGGQGQLSNVDEALVRVTGQPKRGINFAGVDDTRAALESAGWRVDRVELRPDPLRLDDPELLETYLGVVCLGSYLAELEPDEQRPFVARVAQAMPEPVVDYVRLEIEAHRPRR